MTKTGTIHDLKSHNKPCVYVLRFECGMVKVGFSENVKVRLSLIQRERVRDGRSQIEEAYIGEFETLGAADVRRIEQLMHAQLRVIATAVDLRREYFTGIAFEDVVSLLKRHEDIYRVSPHH